ncbi:Uncharacterized protein Fot_21713 [Forsythia ovata]|uniref:Uncharacterized protein n=1 Tax=Forsythia ovata TaxID=205694 RepID=A0ABD1UVQ7_9LAMI
MCHGEVAIRGHNYLGNQDITLVHLVVAPRVLVVDDRFVGWWLLCILGGENKYEESCNAWPPNKKNYEKNKNETSSGGGSIGANSKQLRAKSGEDVEKQRHGGDSRTIVMTKKIPSTSTCSCCLFSSFLHQSKKDFYP